MKKTKFDFEPRWFVVLIFFVAGVFLGGLGIYTYVYNGNFKNSIKKIHPAGADGYKYINPLLAVDSAGLTGSFFENKILEGKFRDILKSKQNNHGVIQGSVYFRDLEAGRWTGLNEDLSFSPGVFLKIPIMVAWYARAQNDPQILDKELVYVKKDILASTSVLVDQNSYTVNDLIKFMMVNDDDAAAEVLYNNIEKNSLNSVYSDIGINLHEDNKNYDFVNNKTYALLFRVLYNATYLNRDYSEKALALLDQIPDTDGIGQVVPLGSALPHKYKDRLVDSKTYESYDCGLAYFPGHPFVICMIGTGKSLSEIHDMFKQFSQAAYDDMKEQYPIN